MSNKCKKALCNHFIALLITLFGTIYGVSKGIDESNKNIERQDTKVTKEYLLLASEDALHQSKVLNQLAKDIQEIDYKSSADINKLENVLYRFNYTGITLPYPYFAQKVLNDHRVLSRLSPTGISSLYRVQEQLDEEREVILGNNRKQQNYMIATKNYPEHFSDEQAALAVDVFVRKQALHYYEKHLEILSNILLREVDYIEGKYTADEIKNINYEEERRKLKEFTDDKKTSNVE